jgi:4-amino-4-deoxy-L-arabinose transferase-like glycosyltransferase
MEKSVANAAPPPEGTNRRPGTLGLLLLLLLLAAGLRSWVIWRTEVMARDSIVFIDYALQLEEQPWQEVLRGNHQHPGYPLSVLAMSGPVRYFLGGTNPMTMQLSAQLASALAGLLLVIPMFYLGLELFDPRIAFWATLLFQCLPVSGLILSDGLSEALYLLLVASALLLGVRALRCDSAFCFGLCGLFGGLAYLTRPEGAVVVAAAVVLLVLMQGLPTWRRGWKWTLASGASLIIPALVVGSPYLLATGHLTNKPSGQGVVTTARRDDHQPTTHPALAEARRPTAPVPATASFSPPPMTLAVWLNKDESLSERIGISLLAVLGEIMKGFHHVAWLPALLGFWWSRDRLRPRPEAWLLLLACLVHGLILWRLAMVASYVSERHVLLVVMCGLYPAVVGFVELPARFALWLRVLLPQARFRLAGNAAAWSLLLLLALITAALVKTLRPLHANRVGHHMAGLWLAKNADSADEICDSHFGWAYYYSGRLSKGAQAPSTLAGGRRIRYVIKGSSKERENPYGPTNARADMTMAQIQAAGGWPAYRWPKGSEVDRAKVVVWAVPLPAVGTPK